MAKPDLLWTLVLCRAILVGCQLLGCLLLRRQDWLLEAQCAAL
jgi:hypothetical protein